ncbi:MAG: AAA family ATPase, partial [Lachnospiraceae bacterium]|nr:AAA family ATPase [Lachnospiraceae bacterium]
MHRKTVRKIALIQWACFQYEVVEVKGSTLITGVNGSGKSTILDAVTYLLTANIQFNLAAKDRDRTVKGYVRGDTKSNGKDQFLRTGEVTSYIAAELVSEVDGSSFVIGVCIESPGVADRCTPYWFILKNTALSDVRMADVKEGRLVVFPRRLLTVRGTPLKLSEFMGRDKARPQILRALGLRCDPEKYRNKLIKMMAFNPENNVDQFIQNCVLDEKYVNSLGELRSQKEKFEELRGIYENLKISREKLEVVEQKTAEFENTLRLYINRSLMLRYQDMLYHQEEKGQIERRIKALQGELRAAGKQFRGLEAKHERAMERYNTARSNSDYQDVSSSIEALNTQIAYLNEEIGRNRRSVEALKALGERIAEIRGKLAKDWSFGFEEEQSYEHLGDATIPPEKCRDALLLLIERLETLRDGYDRESYRMNREREDLREALSEIAANIRELENNRIPYPENAVRVRDTLRVELEKQHPGIQVRFFAELVQEVRDDTWRSAIETFLANKRFYLVVDDAYVDEALRILNDRKLHDTNLVLSDRLPDTEPERGSGAEILTIPNRAARRYANYLLNGIHLCQTLEELHDHPKGGLTRDGMLAKSYSAGSMNIKKTRCYMGMEAVNLQIAQYRQEQEALQKQEK